MIEHIIQFIRETEKLGMALNREQLCKLVLEMLGSFDGVEKPLLMPYKRIAVYEDVAKLERRTSKMLQVSYIDELQDKYEAHFEFLKGHVVPQVQGTRSLI